MYIYINVYGWFNRSAICRIYMYLNRDQTWLDIYCDTLIKVSSVFSVTFHFIQCIYIFILLRLFTYPTPLFHGCLLVLAFDTIHAFICMYLGNVKNCNKKTTLSRCIAVVVLYWFRFCFYTPPHPHPPPPPAHTHTSLLGFHFESYVFISLHVIVWYPFYSYTNNLHVSLFLFIHTYDPVNMFCFDFTKSCGSQVFIYVYARMVSLLVGIPILSQMPPPPPLGPLLWLGHPWDATSRDCQLGKPMHWIDKPRC